MFLNYKMCYDEKREKTQDAKKEEARVKIAVLDTGLQLEKALYVNHVRAGRINPAQSKDFVATTEEDAVDGWKKDSDGHGSRIGQIILDVAPGTVLHIAKVFKNKEDLKRLDTAPQVIAKAIERATEESDRQGFEFSETAIVLRSDSQRSGSQTHGVASKRQISNRNQVHHGKWKYLQI
ncbi:hypothetical protein KJ359_001909 [Pestalotiopsis sp. 9143b]|nr:hypothetical protein KJ359_001909 [Pestalotiopsis sp. 9143b]